MKIAVISDQHLGFGWGTEREDDPFENFKEALERSTDADIILLPGDVFDRKKPRQEVLGRAIDLFRKITTSESDVSVREGGDKAFSFNGTPVIAIHGTHERRSSDFLNPIQLLEKIGYVCHLHNEHIILEKNDTTVAIHGMSGVPERYAPSVLQQFDPTPVEDAVNILLLHQSIENFVYTDADNPALKLEHLPDGFDYIIDGHIHWRNLDMQDNDRPLIFPGSTITTQLNKIEAETPKGFLIIDTENDNLAFHELETPRNVIHNELDVTGMTGSEVREAFDEIMKDIEATDKKPLVRINITGKTDATISTAELQETWQDKAILKIGKNISEQTKEQKEIMYEERDVRQMGVNVLQDKLEWQGIQDIFTSLANGEIEEAHEILEDVDKKEREQSNTDHSTAQDKNNAERNGKDTKDESRLEAFIE